MGEVLTIATAGSALIQACEKAGVTIPRYAECPIYLSRAHTDVFLDTVTMSKLIRLPIHPTN
jgi:hypothetical protein